MNPYYQFALAEKYSNANAGMQLKEDVLDVPSPPKPMIEVESEQANPTSLPNKPLTVSEPVSTTTSTGDTSIAQPQGTTINVYNPSGQTSSTSTSSGVSIDSGTGQFETIATNPNTGVVGGGIGSSRGSSNKSQAVITKRKKSIFPLVIIALGISVFIFKPFK